jgi:hypothetical membrane protein
MKTAGAIVWICAAQFFVVQAVVQLAWRTPFSLMRNYISDLGNTACGPYPRASGHYVCSPWHAGMNASFALQGMLIAAGALLLRRSFPPGASRSTGVLLLVVGGLGNVAVGLYPENVNILRHSLGAAGILILGNLGLIPLGAALARDPRRRGLASAAIGLGTVGLVAMALFLSRIFLGIGAGGMERVVAYALPVWLIAAGVSFARE